MAADLWRGAVRMPLQCPEHCATFLSVHINRGFEGSCWQPCCIIRETNFHFVQHVHATDECQSLTTVPAWLQTLVVFVKYVQRREKRRRETSSDKPQSLCFHIQNNKPGNLKDSPAGFFPNTEE